MPDYNAASLPRFDGQTIIITGATSGIGRATAAALTERGARVTLAVRDPTKGAAVADELPGAVTVAELDLADLTSVRRFCERWDGPIDALVNNAGVAARTLQRTADGFELDFGTNHLGHFALTLRLRPHLRGCVVTVASQAERGARLDLEDPNWERRPFKSSRAYNDSKLANLLFTAELQRRLSAAGSPVRALAAHPGLVITAIYERPADVGPNIFDRLMPHLGQSPAEGALPTLYALAEDLPGDSFTGPQHLLHMRGGAQVIGRSRAARDPELAARLWTLSEALTGTPWVDELDAETADVPGVASRQGRP